jgi:conjugal transfer pilus assembly protein TraW
MKNKLILGLIFIATCTIAEDLGKLGKTYPIGEDNLLAFIKSRATQMMQSGEWEKLHQRVIKKTEQRIDYPPIISGISKTTESSVRYFDPSIKINQDIVDPFTKKLIAKKGQIINPTTYMPFNNELIFIDGRDDAQVQYAVSQSKISSFRVSIILIAANKFRKLLKDQQQLMFYDQGAVLVKKFNIQHVPTIIYQDQSQPTKLRIEEIKL